MNKSKLHALGGGQLSGLGHLSGLWRRVFLSKDSEVRRRDVVCEESCDNSNWGECSPCASRVVEVVDTP